MQGRQGEVILELRITNYELRIMNEGEKPKILLPRLPAFGLASGW